MDPGPIRVVVADDHPVVRRGICALLSSLDGVEVIAEAASGAEAVREAQLGSPDVVLMDISMPGMDGVEATRRVLAAAPDTAVLMLTMFDDDDTVRSALQAGARGYLLKGAEQAEILAALRSVVTRQLVIGAELATRMVGQLSSSRRQPEDPFPALTARERQVLEHIARGSGNATIAAGLGMAPKTVGNNVSAIFAKLGVATRAEAIVRAREQGMGLPAGTGEATTVARAREGHAPRGSD